MPRTRRSPYALADRSFKLKACYTRSSEPILLPKVRINFADFPYLHCSKTRGFSPWGPDAVIGTVYSPNISLAKFLSATRNNWDTANAAVLLHGSSLISDWINSKVSTTCYKEKRTLPQGPNDKIRPQWRYRRWARRVSSGILTRCSFETKQFSRNHYSRLWH